MASRGHDGAAGRVRLRASVRARACGAAALQRRGFPDLELAAEAHEHHGVGEPGMGGEFGRQHDAALLVRFERGGVGVEREGEVVLVVAEHVEALHRRRRAR